MAILNLNEYFEEIRKNYQSTKLLNFYVSLFNLKEMILLLLNLIL